MENHRAPTPNKKIPIEFNDKLYWNINSEKWFSNTWAMEAAAIAVGSTSRNTASRGTSPLDLRGNDLLHGQVASCCMMLRSTSAKGRGGALSRWLERRLIQGSGTKSCHRE